MGTEERNILKIFLQKLDWLILGTVGILVIFGLILVYSATIRFDNPLLFVVKQFIALVLGILVFVLLASINYEIYKTYFYRIYIVSILLLIVVLIFGTSVRGTRAWLNFGQFSIQVSELTRLLFIISLAGYLDKEWRELYRWQKLVIPIIMLLGNVCLILLQPDFSGIVMYFPIFITVLFCANVRILHLLGIILYGFVTVSIPLLKTLLRANIKYGLIVKLLENNLYVILLIVFIGLFLLFLWWFLRQLRIFIPIFYFICTFLIIISGVISSYVVDHSLKEYQKKRLIVFINPNIDPLGSGYNIIQSKIAIGSGRIFGKGIFNGKQTQLGYVPARHTDFIFSLLGEEMGFVFSTFVVILYLILVLRCIKTARVARDRYGSLVATGISAMFAFYALINIGMVIGMMPITGLPLPFFSYGGSSLFASLAAIGLLQSIYIRRFIY
jgi:rod shape determining protein RodA